MEIAALASFAVLFCAWLLAPDRPRTASAAEFISHEAEPVVA